MSRGAKVRLSPHGGPFDPAGQELLDLEEAANLELTHEQALPVRPLKTGILTNPLDRVVQLT